MSTASSVVASNYAAVWAENTTVSDRVQKEGMKTDAYDTTLISIQYH